MDYNPLAIESRANPCPGYDLLRREAPIHEMEPFGVFAVSRHRDVLDVLKHPDVYSSAGMRVMMAGETSMMGSGRSRGRSSVLLESDNLIATNPPTHDKLRAVVNRGFTPSRISAIKPRIREIPRDCLASLPSTGEMDLVANLSMPLPVRVNAEFLGVPPEKLRDFKRWSDAIITSATSVPGGTDAEEALRTREEFLDYFAEAIAGRRKKPVDDLISSFVLRKEKERLPKVRFSPVPCCSRGGDETTTNLLGNGLIALTEHQNH